MKDTGSNIDNQLSAIVTRALTELFESNSNMDNSNFEALGQEQLRWANIEDFINNNTCGKNGTAQKRFRMTKDQLRRGLSREEAFTEFNRAYTEKNGVSD